MRFLLAALLLGASMSVGATSVVLASFAVPANADRLADDVAALGLEASIQEVEINGRRYFRVVVPVSGAEGAGPALDVADRLGIDGAWISYADAPSPPPVARSVVAPQPDDAPSVLRPAPDDPAPNARPTSLVRTPEARTTGLNLLRRTAPPDYTTEQPSEAPGGQVPLELEIERGEAFEVAYQDVVDIRLDGRLDESVWQAVDPYDAMVVIEPDTLGATKYRTETHFVYTNAGLYIGVWNEQPPATFIARLSSRDESVNRDSWGIALDTSGEGLYGYWFTVNLGGTVEDGQVAPEREFTREWDGPWQSATAELADGWSLEMFLPWSMMSMPRGDAQRRMGVWTNRKVAHLDERWSAPGLPNTMSRFMSALQPVALPRVAPRQQISAFPYVSATVNNESHKTPDSVEDTYRAGADVFWRPTSNLQLTATAYPDFGAVESDDVVVNLTATETFFPEKRLFFVEGNELFVTSPRSSTSTQRSASTISSSEGSGGRRTASSFTRGPSTVLNTRRIGGAAVVDIPDDVDVPAIEKSKPTDLLGAVKMTGQSGSLRYGVLAAVEDEAELYGTRDGETVRVASDGRNFGVGRVLYERVGDGRQSIGYVGTLVDHELLDAQVHGIDLHYLSSGGKLQADMQTLSSSVDDVDGYGGWIDLRYTPRRGLTHQFSLDYFDENLDINDLGFLERNNLVGGRYGLSMVRANAFGLKTLASGVSIGHWLNQDYRNVRTGIFLFNTLTFKNSNEFRSTVSFFPKRWEDLESRGNGAYRVPDRWFADLALGTDTSRKLSFSLQAGLRQEDFGTDTWSLGAGFTFKPIDRFSLDFDANYRYRNGWLLHREERRFATFNGNDWQPRLAMDVFFSARQQLRLTMQWAGIRAKSQREWFLPEGDNYLVGGMSADESRALGLPVDDFTISRLTAQLRYRWEIAPLSDLFVVYTRGSNLDNRVDEEFTELFRDALTTPIIDVFVVKLRYRFGR